MGSRDPGGGRRSSSLNGAASPILGPPDDFAAFIFSLISAWYLVTPRPISSSEGLNWFDISGKIDDRFKKRAYMGINVLNTHKALADQQRTDEVKLSRAQLVRTIEGSLRG